MVKDIPFWESRLILKTYAGSLSYGTNLPESDTDFRGVCIPPVEYILGLNRFDQKEINQPNDEVIFSLDKFVRLAIDNNPNILDILFVDDRSVVFINDFGRELRDLRLAFLSKKVYKSYGGYAYSQLKRMTSLGSDANIVGKRKASFDRFGYDTKNAMHLIRLLTMGIEILDTGNVEVYRPDKEFLKNIRSGKYTVTEIETAAIYLREELDQSYRLSALPETPNFDKINSWLISAHERAIQWKQ